MIRHSYNDSSDSMAASGSSGACIQVIKFRRIQDRPGPQFLFFPPQKTGLFRFGVAGRINVEVYSAPAHRYDVDDMIASVKAGLAYYEKNFSPYQFPSSVSSNSPATALSDKQLQTLVGAPFPKAECDARDCRAG